MIKNKIKTIISISALVLTLNACSSTKVIDPRLSERSEQVISRSNQATSRPKWANEEQVLDVNSDGYVYMTIMNEALSSKRTDVSQLYRAAELEGKAMFTEVVKQKIDTFVQRGRESGEFGGKMTETTSSWANLTISNLLPSNRYWEKIAVSEDINDYTIKYRVFVRLKIKETELNEAIRKAISGDAEISQDLKRQMLAQEERIFNN